MQRLLIEPLLELKQAMKVMQDDAQGTFNRTTFGIETSNQFLIEIIALPFNRTTFGIETLFLLIFLNSHLYF